MLKYFIGHTLILALTAPWVFLIGAGGTLGGLPIWAIYTVVASAGYALFVSISYARLWDRSANEEDVS